VRSASGPLAPAPSVADLAGGRWPAGLDDRLPSVFRAGRPESATAVAFASASRLQRAACRPRGRAVQGTAPRPGGHRRAPSSRRQWGRRPAAFRLHPRSLRSRLLLSSQPSPGGRDFHGARGFAPHPPANPRWGAGGPVVAWRRQDASGAWLPPTRARGARGLRLDAWPRLPGPRSPLGGEGAAAPLPLGQVRGAAPPTSRRYARWTFCRMQHAACAYTMLHVVCCMRIHPVSRWLSSP